ncbi:PQQ-binding-like beta-propeller repeat protein [Streptomyces palmae]|uniref:protein kinase domain-containing protein n=1 Tax=Streptomyces palmae TaxID=1701085 RepID=UPI0035F050AC
MGVVHLARSDSGLRLAVKVVHADFAADPEFRARFRQEVAAARRVSGAFTAPVVDANPDSERPWMATLYIPGPTLAEHVKRNGPLEPDEVFQLAAGLAEALRDIHRAGVVHRDLKPSNVLLAADGPKVIDFGISRPADSDLRTETGKLIGTPPFMAPEQFQRPRTVGPAADVFALGSVLVHAATGSGPFDSESPYIVAYQVVHDEADLTGVPGQLEPLIRRCLAKDPEQRPTPDALMAALRAVRGPYAPAPRGPLPKVPAQRSRHGGEPHAEPEPAGHPHPVDGPPQEAPGPRQGESATPPGTGGTEGPRSGRFAALRALPPRGARGWLALGTAAVVLLGAGTWWTLRQLDAFQGGSRQRGHRTPAVHQPWQTTLGTPDQHGPEAGPHAAYCSYGRGALYCAGPGVRAARLNPADGEVVWSLPDRDPATEGGTSAFGAPTPPVLSGGLVQVLSADGTRLEGLDPRTDRPRWQRDVSAYGGRIYRAGDTALLVAADGTVTAIDSATNRPRWRHRVPGHALPGFFSGPAGDTAYAVTVTGDGSRTLVTAVDPVRGRKRWQRWLDGNLTPAGTGPRGTLYFTASDTVSRVAGVVRYTPSDHEQRRIPLPTPVTLAGVTSHGDAVYLLSGDGGLLSVDTAPGAKEPLRWRLETSVGNASPLLATEDRVYFSAADGRLLAVDAFQGRILGQTPLRTGKPGQGYAGTLPAPIIAAGRVVGSSPDGTLFAVDAGAPEEWSGGAGGE